MKKAIHKSVFCILYGWLLYSVVFSLTTHAHILPPFASSLVVFLVFFFKAVLFCSGTKQFRISIYFLANSIQIYQFFMFGILFFLCHFINL